MVIATNVVNARYLTNARQVVIEDIYYDIVAENNEFVALFRPGRSVYKPNIGSEYEPARIFFCKFVGDREPIGESWTKLLVLLEAPIRRR
jgi:hypothetical protein